MDLGSLTLPPKRANDLNGYDGSKPSVALVACDGHGHGCLIWWAGGHLSLEVEEAGLTDLADLGLDDCPVGVWVWEGIYVYWPSVTCEGIDEGCDAESKGAFRAPTDEEWAAIRENRSPWNPDDWKLPEEK